MFTNIDINLFIPKEKNKMMSHNMTLMEVIEEDFGSLERFQYYVSHAKHPPRQTINSYRRRSQTTAQSKPFYTKLLSTSKIFFKRKNLTSI